MPHGVIKAQRGYQAKHPLHKMGRTVKRHHVSFPFRCSTGLFDGRLKILHEKVHDSKGESLYRSIMGVSHQDPILVEQLPQPIIRDPHRTSNMHPLRLCDGIQMPSSLPHCITNFQHIHVLVTRGKCNNACGWRTKDVQRRDGRSDGICNFASAGNKRAARGKVTAVRHGNMRDPRSKTEPRANERTRIPYTAWLPTSLLSMNRV